MTNPLIIVGCGGFGREVFSMVEAINERARGTWQVLGFADDSPSATDLESVASLGSTVVGTVADLRTLPAPYCAVLAIGSSAARASIDALLANAKVTFPALSHPDATLGLGVVLGPGAIIAPGARLSTNIRVGRHVHVDQNATVGHDSSLGDFSRLNPQACVSGSVTIGDRALIGAGATVLQGLSLGTGCTVGAGACVVKDVPPGSVVKGVPAK